MAEALLAMEFDHEGGVVMKENIERIQEASKFLGGWVRGCTQPDPNTLINED